MKKNGEILYVDINTAVATIEGNMCSVSIFRDITNRKEKEEDLKLRNVILSTQQEASSTGYLW